MMCSQPDPALLDQVSERSKRIAAGVVEDWSDLRLHELIEYAAIYTKVPSRALVGPARVGRIPAARRVAFWICRRSGVYSLSTIGRAFNRAHSSILRGARNAQSDMPPEGLMFDPSIGRAARERFEKRLFSVISGGRA
jgi:chromosomal replication initiation ATPase DnaA